MNQQRVEQINRAEVLRDQNEQWKVLRRNADSAFESPSVPEARLPAAPAGGAGMPDILATVDAQGERNHVESDSPSDDLYLDRVETVVPAAPVVRPEERSMLDRLRGLYDDQEASARSLLRRNLQRLPNPWNVFRDRSSAPVPTETAEVPVEPAVPDYSEPSIGSVPAPSLPSVDRAAVFTLVESFESDLERWPREPNGQLSDPERYYRRQQDLRLLYLIADQPEEAIASLPGVSGPEQEFWQELMLALAQFRADDELSREARFTVTVGQLRAALGHLTDEAEFGLQRLEICSQINSFGRVRNFPSNDFDSIGQPVLLYAELENFGTELTAQGTERTSFDAQIQFLHADGGKPIETIELTEISDESTSDRTDFFLSFELNIPSHLASGEYRIRLQVRDRIRRRTAEGIVDFQVR